MVGGWIIENVPVRLVDEDDIVRVTEEEARAENETLSAVNPKKIVRRLWCVDRNGDEALVFVESAAVILACGEQVWWQGDDLWARNDKLRLIKLGPSFRPSTEEYLERGV